MNPTTNRHAAVFAVAAVALITASCGNAKDLGGPPTHIGADATSTSRVATPPTEIKVMGESDVQVTLTGPIAVKYAAATTEQKQQLGKPLTGDHNAGTRDSGLIFQQFQGGVITARDDHAGTPAFITLGKIREAWNVQRGPDGAPAVDGQNGSAGPLGFPTSDQVADGDVVRSEFEHGKIEYNSRTAQVQVTVNGKVVPSGV